jgi:hypothetical protein
VFRPQDKFKEDPTGQESTDLDALPSQFGSKTGVLLLMPLVIYVWDAFETGIDLYWDR